MSMLSEHRRKTKWVINPTKKPLWSTDSIGIKFGKQLMEKMGWSAGKGLGVNEQGIQEPLKVSFKSDTKGMGFKGNDDDWIEHQDEFNNLLNKLNTVDSSVEKGLEVDKCKIKSLEEKSKQSKARVHYQKFTRGKDISRYTENDLACILGTNKTKKEKTKVEEVIKTEPNTNGNFDTSFGVTTINSGSIHDYFKKKWTIDKVKFSNFTTIDTAEESVENCPPDFPKQKSCDDEGVRLENEEQNSVKKKHKFKSNLLYVEESGTPELDKAESIERVQEEKKKKRQRIKTNLGKEPKSKKIKNNSYDNGGLIDENLQKESKNLSVENKIFCNAREEKKTKKQKKVKSHLKLEISDNESKSEKEGRRPKKYLDEYTIQDLCGEDINPVNNGDSMLEVESVKKKDRKENFDEFEVIENNCNDCDMKRSCLEVHSIKSKEKKKGKLEKVEEIDNKNSSITHIKDFCDVANIEKMNGTCQMDIFELVSRKKKRKRNKKEKVEEVDNNEIYTNQEEPSTSESNKSLKVAEKVNNWFEREDTLEIESGKKKKKKKGKEEKLEKKETEHEDCNSKQVEKSNTEDMNMDYKEKVKLEIESVRKKKFKKESLVENENKASVEEEKQDLEIAEDVEFIRKKKEKKGKKEEMGENEGIEKRIEKSFQLQVAEETSVEVKSESEVIVKTTDLDGSKNEVKGVLNTSTGENRMQKLRANLFPDRAADKYFPEKTVNERVLRLVRWVNIAEFRGSNLMDVEGYGHQTACGKQSKF